MRSAMKPRLMQQVYLVKNVSFEVSCFFFDQIIVFFLKKSKFWGTLNRHKTRENDVIYGKWCMTVKNIEDNNKDIGERERELQAEGW